MRVTLAIALFAGSGVVVGSGCGSAPAVTAEAAEGDLVVDPVCGMDVAVFEGGARVEHAGKTWHFCSIGCADLFAKEPATYAKNPTTNPKE